MGVCVKKEETLFGESSPHHRRFCNSSAPLSVYIYVYDVCFFFCLLPESSIATVYIIEVVYHFFTAALAGYAVNFELI